MTFTFKPEDYDDLIYSDISSVNDTLAQSSAFLMNDEAHNCFLGVDELVKRYEEQSRVASDFTACFVLEVWTRAYYKLMRGQSVYLPLGGSDQEQCFLFMPSPTLPSEMAELVVLSDTQVYDFQYDLRTATPIGPALDAAGTVRHSIYNPEQRTPKQLLEYLVATITLSAIHPRGLD